jgi:hypothetical protein
MYSLLNKDPSEPYNEVVTKVRGYFGHSASTYFAPAEFTRCQQRPRQTVTQFVAQIEEIAAKGAFSAEQMKERFRDQLVAWCRHDKILLLQEPTVKSLDEVLTLSATAERASVEAPPLTVSPIPVQSKFQSTVWRSNSTTATAKTGSSHDRISRRRPCTQSVVTVAGKDMSPNPSSALPTTSPAFRARNMSFLVIVSFVSQSGGMQVAPAVAQRSVDVVRLPRMKYGTTFLTTMKMPAILLTMSVLVQFRQPSYRNVQSRSLRHFRFTDRREFWLWC